MGIPSSNSSISFSQIQAELGGTNPINLSEYYSDNTNTYFSYWVRNIPSQGSSFSVSTLSSKSKPSGNLITNGDFTSSTSNWTVANGFSPSGAADNRPFILVNTNVGTGLGSYLMFGVDNSNVPVQQTINSLRGSSEYEFSFYVQGINNGSASTDPFKAYVTFYDSSNNQVGSLLGQTTYIDAPSGAFGYYAFRGSGYAGATKATVSLFGYDKGNWAGQYGTQYALCGLEVPNVSKPIILYGIAGANGVKVGNPGDVNLFFGKGSSSMNAVYRIGIRTSDGIQYSTLTIPISSTSFSMPQLMFFCYIPVSGLIILERSDAGGAYYMVNTRRVNNVSSIMYDYNTTGG